MYIHEKNNKADVTRVEETWLKPQGHDSRSEL